MIRAKDTGQPAHVLFLVDVLRGLEFRDGTTHGLAGIESVLLKIIRMTPSERYRFSVATFALGENPPPADKFPCPLYCFPFKRTYDWTALRMAHKLRRLIRSENINIVHTFLESADIWGGMVAKLSGCPIVVSSRRDMGYFRSPKHLLAYRVVNHFVDQVQAVSEEVRSFLIRQDGLDPRKVVTVYNGIELERLAAANGASALRSELGLEASGPIITSVANIRPVKGLDVLIRTAATVCREFSNARFLIVGKVIDHRHFDQLRSLVQSLQLTNNVIFVGSSERVPSLLKLSTLFCLLSRSEGFSNAILEAMGIGLPCVVTRVGGNPEAIEDGHSGFLVPTEDVDAAADRILMLLRDTKRSREMGVAAHRTAAAKFTARAMVNRWVELYDELRAARYNQRTTS